MNTLLHLCCWSLDVESWNRFQFIQSSSRVSQAPPTDHRHLTNTHLRLWHHRVSDCVTAGVMCVCVCLPYTHRQRAQAPTPDWLYLPPLLLSVCQPPAPPTRLAMTSLPLITSSPWSGSQSPWRAFPSARSPSAWPLNRQRGRSQVINWRQESVCEFERNSLHLSGFLGWFSWSPRGWRFWSLHHSALLRPSSSWSGQGSTSCQSGEQQNVSMNLWASVRSEIQTRELNILTQQSTFDATQGNSKPDKHKNRYINNWR